MDEETELQKAERHVRESMEIIARQRSLLARMEPGSPDAGLARQAVSLSEDMLALDREDLTLLRGRRGAQRRREPR
jgi:hypothetical protein